MVYHSYYYSIVKPERTDLIVYRYISKKFYKIKCAKCDRCFKAECSMEGSYKVECRLDKSKADNVHERMNLYSCGDKMIETT